MREETIEEREIRLAKHAKLVKFIVRVNFRQEDSNYECKHCNGVLIDENEAVEHYFQSHKGMKPNDYNPEKNKFKSKRFI